VVDFLGIVVCVLVVAVVLRLGDVVVCMRVLAFVVLLVLLVFDGAVARVST
jgi:hypothetical protein